MMFCRQYSRGAGLKHALRNRTAIPSQFGERCIHSKMGTIFNQIGVAFNQKPLHQQNDGKLSQGKFSKILPLISSSSLSGSGISSANQTASFFNRSVRNAAGLFGLKELNTHEGFFELKDRAESRVNELMNEAFQERGSAGKPRRKLVQIFDDISNELCRVADLAEFVRSTHPNMKYRNAADQTFGYISQIVEKLNTNYKLYAKLKTETEHAERSPLPEGSAAPKLDECDLRVSKLYLLDFEQSGIHLDEKVRNQFVRVNDELINLLMKFQVNSQTPSTVYASELEPRFNSMKKYYNDPMTVETMFINSDDELLREFVYKSFLQKNPSQDTYFRLILSKRKQLADLCGFKSFAHRANVSMIMETPENVVNFLDHLSQSIADKAQKDFDLIADFKRNALKSSQPLAQWDVPYLTNRIKKQKYELENSNYMNYFSLGSCMEGLNIILNKVYNVNLEITEVQPGEMWHDDIYKLAVKDAKHGLLGYIYCDFYHRQHKFTNVDCHFTIQCSKLLEDGSYQIPIVVLHLNFPSPTRERPTLLSFEMMENLFHEFGHAMHSMFAKTRYQHVSGTRCSTDFAEVPSQLFEYYIREPQILKLFAKHYATGEPLDDRIIHKLCESKKLFGACDLQLQLLHSMLDQAFHLADLDGGKQDPTQITRQYTNKYYSLPFVENTHWHLRFSHLVGYGAKYYSYLVSKAIAAKIWSECFEKDPLSSTAGDNYRYKLLAFGGEKRPRELLSSLIGLDVENSSLVNSLTKHL